LSSSLRSSTLGIDPLNPTSLDHSPVPPGYRIRMKKFLASFLPMGTGGAFSLSAGSSADAEASARALLTALMTREIQESRLVT
jgi:hypothetical protein